MAERGHEAIDKEPSVAERPFRWRWYDTLSLYLPFGLLTLLCRHWAHYHRGIRRPPWRGIEYPLQFIPFGFYLALAIRKLREAFAREPVHDDSSATQAVRCPICRERCVNRLLTRPDYPERLAQEILGPMSRRYFRTEVHGLEKLPAKGPAIIMMNHAGMAFPWDFLIFGARYTLDRDGRPPLRGPGERVFTRNPIMGTILPDRWLESVGGVEVSYPNIERLIRHGEVILYAPEGAAGMAKGWHHRYQLTRFHCSFVKLAEQYDVPIYPAICIGSENLHPWSFNLPRLAKWLGFPFFGLSPFAPFVLPFPSMLVWSIPTRLSYHIFDPVRIEPSEDGPRSKAEWKALARQYRVDLQQKIDQLRPR